MFQSHWYFIGLCCSRQSRKISVNYFIIRKLEHADLFLSRLVTVVNISVSLHVPLSHAVRMPSGWAVLPASLKKPDKQPSSS